MQIKSVSKHRPEGMIVDVDEDVAKQSIKMGEFVKVDESVDKKIPKIEKEKPNKKWTELEIYDWIKKNNIPIKYDPRKHREADVLRELKEKGYI